MKYLKTYDNSKNGIVYTTDEVKELLSHFIKIFSQYGLDYSSYYDRGSYEIEFDLKDNNKSHYLFTILINPRISFFTIRESLANENHEIVKFVPEYFMTIKGLKYLGYLDHNHDFEVKTSVEDIIKQITLEDFELKFNAYKYNL